jgi:16S rRNA (adenine1518-N6/adenine1519-N6)-dimethyltransferase
VSVSELLRAHGLHPKKKLGQNFLMNPHTAGVIAEAATTPEGGVVLEIGPGLGALTRPLVARAARVVAIERDRDLVPLLQAELAEPIAAGRLEIIEGDAARVDWAAPLAAGPAPRVVAGNLPYSITGLLIERVTHLSAHIDRAVFMVQSEVADRLAAPAGSPAYGALSVFVQAAFDVRRLLTVRAGSFYPRPEVESAVVVLTPRRPARVEETDAFRAAVKAAFATRRKTLRNAWRGLYGWSKDELEQRAAEAAISLDARGETLSVDDFARIAAKAPPAAGTDPKSG